VTEKLVNEEENRSPEEAPAPQPEQPQVMAAPERREEGPRERPRGRGRFVSRRKVCHFCVQKITDIDYKNADSLRRYLSDRGKIEPRRKTGTCAKHQRRLTMALKRARHLALLPYTAEHIRSSGIQPSRS